MSISQHVSNDGKNVHINIKGNFSYKLSDNFRNAYRYLPEKKGVVYHVGLNETDYMDSSALGMLLMLREHAKCRGGSVVLESPSENIGRILKIANFEQLFVVNEKNNRVDC